MIEGSELLKPRKFWNQIDLLLDITKEWVKENYKDVKYQCCGRASDIFFSLLIKWGIRDYAKLDLIPRIARGIIREIQHDWVEISTFIFDPTVMQFEPVPSNDEYSRGFHYYEDDEEYEPAYSKILENEETQQIVNELLDKFYGILFEILRGEKDERYCI